MPRCARTRGGVTAAVTSVTSVTEVTGGQKRYIFFYCTNRQISSSSIQRYRSGKSSAVGSIFPGRSKLCRDLASCTNRPRSTYSCPGAQSLRISRLGEEKSEVHSWILPRHSLSFDLSTTPTFLELVSTHHLRAPRHKSGLARDRPPRMCTFCCAQSKKCLSTSSRLMPSTSPASAC